MKALPDHNCILKKTFLITLISSIFLLGGLALVVKPNQWPPIENSPHQGEAMDVSAFKKGQTIFSQEALSKLIREPQNTWSNFAFIIGGAYLFSIGATRSSRFLGIPLIIVGFGSFLYHASISPTLRHLDAGSFTWLLLATSLFAIASFFPRLQKKLEDNLAIFAGSTFLFAVVSTIFRKTVIFGLTPLALDSILGLSATILLGSLIILVFLHRQKEIALRTGVAMSLFGLAVLFQVGDHPGHWLCNPEFLIQAHAVWHLFAAVAFVLAVRALDLQKSL